MNTTRIKQKLSYLILGQKGGYNRIQILKLLVERPYNLNQLAEILNVNYRTIKHHMDIMLKNDLVSSSKTGGYGDVYFLTTDMEGNMDLFKDIVNKFEKSKKLKDFASSPEFLERVMEQTNDTVIITNSERQTFFWNKSAESLLGYTKEEIIGDIPNIFPDIDVQDEMIKKVEAGETVIGYETKLKHKSEDLIDVSVTIDAIKDENEKIMGYSMLSRDITERKLVENALRESEELHRITLGAISDTVVITDDDGKFTFICPNIDFIFGFSKNEVQGFEHVSKLLGEDLFDKKELHKKGEIKNIELDVPDKSGDIHSLLMNVKNVSIKGGTILYTCHDITKRKKVEEALKISEERYAMAQQAANIGSWDWDILTGDLAWSDTIESMFGFGSGKFGATYEAFLDCVHPDDRPFVIDSVNECVDEGKDYDIEHRIVWPDGTIRVVSEIGNVFRDDSGKAIRMLGIVQDITERKDADAALRENEEKYHTTFNMSPDLLYRVGSEGEILDCNDTAVGTLGYSRDELIGMKLFDIYSDESKAKAKEFFEEWKKTGKLRNKKLIIITKDGSEIDVSLNVNAIHDPSGNVLSSISSQRIIPKGN